jgi:hypothetical protein
VFCEPGEAAAGQREIAVSLQGRRVIDALDIAREAGGPMRALVREVAGVAVESELRVEIEARRGETVLSGIEVVREGLPLEPVPVLEERATRQLFGGE